MPRVAELPLLLRKHGPTENITAEERRQVVSERSRNAGKVPRDGSFFFPSYRNLKRHRFPPLGAQSKYKPRSSLSFVGLGGVLALRIAVSVSMWCGRYRPSLDSFG